MRVRHSSYSLQHCVHCCNPCRLHCCIRCHLLLCPPSKDTFGGIACVVACAPLYCASPPLPLPPCRRMRFLMSVLQQEAVSRAASARPRPHFESGDVLEVTMAVPEVRPCSLAVPVAGMGWWCQGRVCSCATHRTCGCGAGAAKLLWCLSSCGACGRTEVCQPCVVPVVPAVCVVHVLHAVRLRCQCCDCSCALGEAVMP